METNGRDRKAYLEEQIARQQRGEPIDVEWVRAELVRVRTEQQQKLMASQRQLRWLVITMAVMFSVLWVASNLRSSGDPKLLVPIVLLATLAAWSVYRQRKK